MVFSVKLDEINGTTTPDAWGPSVGTLYGTNGLPQLRPSSECISGGCFKFDGVDDYIDVEMTLFDTSKDYTISFWFKVDNYGDYRELISKQKGSYYYSEIGIRINTDKKLGLHIGNGSSGYYLNSSSNFLYEENKYHYVVLTLNGNNIFLYKNSVFDKGFTPSGFYISNSKISIGRRGESAGGYFQGFMDDVRIYDAALSSSQIKQNYVAGLNSLLEKGAFSEAEFKENVRKMSSNN